MAQDKNPTVMGGISAASFTKNHQLMSTCCSQTGEISTISANIWRLQHHRLSPWLILNEKLIQLNSRWEIIRQKGIPKTHKANNCSLSLHDLWDQYLFINNTSDMDYSIRWPLCGFSCFPSSLELQLSVEQSGSMEWHWLCELLFLGVAEQRLPRCSVSIQNTPFLQLFPRQLTFKGAALAIDCLTLATTLLALRNCLRYPVTVWVFVPQKVLSKSLPIVGSSEQESAWTVAPSRKETRKEQKTNQLTVFFFSHLPQRHKGGR